MHPQDVIGSIYELLGIDPAAPLPNERGLEVTVLPTTEDDTTRAGRLTEIMPA